MLGMGLNIQVLNSLPGFAPNAIQTISALAV